jgi:outer membrane lipoprotein-sorting protein
MNVGFSRRLLLSGLGSLVFASLAPLQAKAQVTAPAPAPVTPRPQPPAAPPSVAPPVPPPAAQPAAPAPAAPTTPGPLTDADRADIARIEEYVNSIRTLRARFVQLSQNGGRAQGTFYLSRPGRMRLEYDPPGTLILIANGGQLQQYDTSLRQQQYVPLSSTPATYLVDTLRLSGDITVVGVARTPQSIEVTIVKTRDPREGRITFIFQNNPLQLRNWTVVDSQNRLIRVTLSELQVGQPLDGALFRFIIGDVGSLPSTAR